MRRMAVGIGLALALGAVPAVAAPDRCASEKAAVKAAVSTVHQDRAAIGLVHHQLQPLERYLPRAELFVRRDAQYIGVLSAQIARIRVHLASFCAGPGNATRAECVEKREHLAAVEARRVRVMGFLDVDTAYLARLRHEVAAGQAQLAALKAKLASDLDAVKAAAAAYRACEGAA